MYKDLEKLVAEWPDFMEKHNQRVRESDGILGTLYRSVCCTQVSDEFIKADYKCAVMLDY
jgi:hypothetical protein